MSLAPHEKTEQKKLPVGVFQGDEMHAELRHRAVNVINTRYRTFTEWGLVDWKRLFFVFVFCFSDHEV